MADMNSSRSFRGRARNGAVFGSISARRIFDAVDFEVLARAAKESADKDVIEQRSQRPATIRTKSRPEQDVEEGL